MRWGSKDVDYIRENYNSKIPISQIALYLNRSPRSIMHKAARLMLSRIRVPANKPKNKEHRIVIDKKYYLANRDEIYRKKRERIKRYKLELVTALGGKCARCGYNKCIAALDFHHSSGIKENAIAELLKNSSRQKALKEVQKCVLLCANCHRELHHKDP